NKECDEIEFEPTRLHHERIDDVLGPLRAIHTARAQAVVRPLVDKLPVPLLRDVVVHRRTARGPLDAHREVGAELAVRVHHVVEGALPISLSNLCPVRGKLAGRDLFRARVGHAWLATSRIDALSQKPPDRNAPALAHMYIER